MTPRLSHLLAQLHHHNLDAALVQREENVRYLSGYTAGEASLLIGPGIQVLITDSRYTEMAERQCPSFDVLTVAGAVTLWSEVERLAVYHDWKTLGIETTHCTIDWYDKAVHAWPFLQMKSMDAIFENMRMIKDAQEIAAIRRAQALTEQAFYHAQSCIRQGVSELDISSEISYYIHKRGGTLAFDTIVASGPHSSMPHAQPSMRKIQPGDFITIDMGARVDGYCSDMTRTFVLGKPTKEMEKIYAVVLQSQLYALDSIRPGMVCNEVDRIAHDYIAQNGYGDCFGHSLGHSFGLFIHEEPRFGPSCTQVLQPGMCLSVEPGIYLPGRFGVRIEDTVCITADGYENLTHVPKEIILL